MAVSRADRRLLAFTTMLVVAAGLLVAVLLWIATGGGADTPTTAPIFVGLEAPLRDSIQDEGPQYIPNPFGDDGFWLDMESDRIVAYVLDLPSKGYCEVQWKEPRRSYIDCRDDKVSPSQLDRYAVELRDRSGQKQRDVFVDLRKVQPAPGASSSP